MNKNNKKTVYSILGFLLVITLIGNFNIKPIFAYNSEQDIVASIHQDNDDDGSLRIEFNLKNCTEYRIRGFYYTDNIPINYVLQQIKVEINGVLVDCNQEIGNEDDISNGKIPYRWIIETPPDFLENKPIEETAGSIKIVYSITPSPTANVYDTSHNNWIGLLDNKTPIFGYYETESIDAKDYTNTEGGCFLLSIPMFYQKAFGI